MNPKAVLAVVALVAVSASVCAASSCSNPVVKSSFFSTSDATIVSQIAFVTEFTLKCSNAGAEKLPLFAEIGGKLAPVVRVGDSKYQVRLGKLEEFNGSLTRPEPYRSAGTRRSRRPAAASTRSGCSTRNRSRPSVRRNVPARTSSR